MESYGFPLFMMCVLVSYERGSEVAELSIFNKIKVLSLEGYIKNCISCSVITYQIYSFYLDRSIHSVMSWPLKRQRQK